jgi:hypothetical protein
LVDVTRTRRDEEELSDAHAGEVLGERGVACRALRRVPGRSVRTIGAGAQGYVLCAGGALMATDVLITPAVLEPLIDVLTRACQAMRKAVDAPTNPDAIADERDRGRAVDAPSNLGAIADELDERRRYLAGQAGIALPVEKGATDA